MIYSQDIGLEFGIEICAMLLMKKGKTMKGIELPNQERLVGWVLSHINLFRLFNAKPIFM